MFKDKKGKKPNLKTDHLTNPTTLIFSKLNPLISTSIASLADRVLSTPIDTVITLQQTGRQTAYYSAKTLWKKEGIVGFYKGMTWPLITTIPSRLSVFGTYYFMRDNLPLVTNYSQQNINIISGITSGITFSLVACPAEAKRIREIMHIQLNTRSFHVRTLYKGFLPFTGRSCVGNTIMLAGSDYLLASIPSPYSHTNWAPFVTGTMAGITSELFITPIDVLKTKVMCDSSSTPLWKHVKNIYTNGQYFDSLKTRMARTGLGAGVIIGVISKVNGLLDNYYNKEAKSEAHPIIFSKRDLSATHVNTEAPLKKTISALPPKR